MRKRHLGNIDKAKLTAQAQAVLASESEAEAEEDAVRSGTLDQDDRTALRIIEAKFTYMASKAELTASVQALETSFGRLRTWALGLIIATLVGVIGLLARVVFHLWK